ncbi:MAG: tetratricopeptide repeat-containing sensor histidine kinase [Melioribacteraceae bacterium]|nr:tetratricopeptide repeat-containing sensor histidine kinase [Melioribacteraceae bacterium]
MKIFFKNKNYIIILFLLMIYAGNIFGQFYRDSLLVQISKLSDSEKLTESNKLANKYRRDDPRTAIVFGDIALDLAIKSSNLEEQGKALANLGSSYFLLQENSKAIDYLTRGKNIAADIEDYNTLAICYQNLGFSYKYDTNFSEAIEFFQQSITLWEEIGNSEREIAASLSAIANIYRVFDNYSGAIDLYLEALDLYKRMNFEEGVAWIDFNIGVLYKKSQNHLKAHTYLTRALNKYTELNDKSAVDNKNGIAMCYSQLASVERKLGNFEKAIEIGEKALNFRLESGIKSVIAEEYSNLGRIYFDIGNIDIAKKYLEEGYQYKIESNDNNGMAIILRYLALIALKNNELKKGDQYLAIALEKASQSNSLLNLQDIYQTYSEIYEKRGLYKKSLEMNKLFMTYKDSIFSDENSRKILIKEIEYKSHKKEEENQALRAENRIKELEINEERVYSNLLLVITLSIIVLVILFYSKYRNQKTANAEIDKQKEELDSKNKELLEIATKLTESNAEKDKFFSIISHDLKSPFTSLLGYSKLLSENYVDFNKEEIQDIVSSMYSGIKNVYQLIEDLLSWANTQTGKVDFFPKELVLKEIVENVIDLTKRTAETKGINVDSDINPKHIVIADKNMLNSILRNLLTNAIKFSKNNDYIYISSIIEDKFIKVVVQDSGIGINDEDLIDIFKLDVRKSRIGTMNEKGTGLGLTMCREFVEKNGGKIWVESKENSGTTFYFTLKTN